MKSQTTKKSTFLFFLLSQRFALSMFKIFCKSTRTFFVNFLLLFCLVHLELLQKGLGRHRLRALDGLARHAVPDERRQHAELARHAEEDRVVVLLLEAVVLQEHAGVRVDVGEGVLRLAVLREDVGHDRVDVVDEAEELVVGEVALAELALARVAGVRLAEDGVAVAGDDAAGVEQLPGELREGLLEGGVVLHVDAGGLALLHHVEEVGEDLLVGEAVEGAGEAVHGGGQRQVGVGQSGANEDSRVGRDVATLVAGVDGEVEAHAVLELGVVEAELRREGGGPVSGLGGRGHRALEAGVAAVHVGGDGGDAGHAVEGILKGELAEVLLVGLALGVRLGEDGARLQGHDADGELGHGVRLGGEGVDGLGGDVHHGVLHTAVEVGVEGGSLLRRRHVTGEEEVEHGLGEGLLATGGLGQLRAALRNGETAEADTLLGVEEGGLVDETRDAAHAAVDGVDGGGAEALVALLLLEAGHLLLVRGDLGLEEVVEDGGLAREERAGGRVERRLGDGGRVAGEGAHDFEVDDKVVFGESCQ
eukprot:PhM_4_TR5366/c0_g1_i1/m.29121